jgi:hypothetical protein
MSVVHEGGVDLVGEHPAVVALDDLGDGAHLVGGEDPAGRVVRVDQHQEIPAGHERGVERIEVVDVAAALVRERQLDHLATSVQGQGDERHVGGRRQDHRGARRREVVDGRDQPGGHVGHGPHALRWHVPAVPLLGERCERAAHAGGEAVRQVAEQAGVDGLVHRLRDDRGGAEVHLGDEHADRSGEHRPLDAADLTEAVDADRVQFECCAHQLPSPAGMARPTGSSSVSSSSAISFR